MTELFGKLGLTSLVSMLEDKAQALPEGIMAPNVPVHCLYGVNQATPEKLIYANMTYFPDYPLIRYGDGDRVVSTKSLELCEQFSSVQSESVLTKTIDGANHMLIINDPTVLKYLAKLLTDKAAGRSQRKSQRKPELAIYNESEIDFSGLLAEANAKLDVTEEELETLKGRALNHGMHRMKWYAEVAAKTASHEKYYEQIRKKNFNE